VSGTVNASAPTSWRDAALELDRWMADRDYAGHDPHDFLASPLVRATTLGRRYPAIAWTQLGKRLPFQLRPALAVPRARNAKGIGLVLAGKVRLAEGLAGSEIDGLVDWLDADAVRFGGGAGWGYPFPWANRDFMAPPRTPSSVATAFVGHALLDARERCGVVRAGALAEEAGRFLTTSLNRIPGPGDTFCLSYTPLDRRAVHNASLLAASLLARLGGAEDTVRPVTRFTLEAQRADGSWPYGIDRRNAWVDSFHTGYVLLALDEIGRHLDVAGLDDAVERGLAYWRGAFFDGPAVGFHPGGRYPVDTHAAAQAILTFLGLRHRIPAGPAEARRLGEWAVAEMRDPSGFYYYQHHGRWRNRLPYMRWVQTWMYRALVELAATERT
jgi:polysaccharide biosynthesis protein VpsJ